MRSRKKRIAVFLVVALFIGIACPYNQREIKEMKAVENNVSYKDGDEIQPLSVDLHKCQMGKQNTRHAAFGFQADALLRSLLFGQQRVQYGEKMLRLGGLEQIVVRLDRIALGRELRRGGQKHQLRFGIEAADFPCGRHPVCPRHHHIQQIERVATASCRGKQVIRIPKGSVMDRRPSLLPVGI